MKRIFFILALLCSFAGFESCRTTVTSRPQPPAAVVRPPQPRPDYVWIDGEWYTVGRKYQYRQGYWAPPRRGHSWVGGHWVKRGHGWYWQKGHWR